MSIIKKVKFYLVIILSFFGFNLSDKNETQNFENDNIDIEMEESKIEIIEDWVALRNTSFNELEKDGFEITKDVIYEKLINVKRVNHSKEAKHYFFFDVNNICVMIYFNDKDQLKTISLQTIIESYGPANGIVRSRAGKKAKHYIYSEKGFAFSALKDEILFFEVFPSMHKFQYLKEIYIEPRAHIK